MSLLDFLQIGGKKNSIGLAISQNGKIELAKVNLKTKEVTQYSNQKIAYNAINREIIDYVELKQAIESLFAENALEPKNCDVVLSLPNIFFSFTKLPVNLSKTEIQEAITSDAEQNFFLRKNPPKVDWQFIDSPNDTDQEKQLATAALPSFVIEQIKDLFEEIGANLVAIETSFSSMIRGILESNFIGELKHNSTTNIVLISATSYSIFTLVGEKWVECFEIPMPIQSLDENEIYPSIVSSVSENLQSYSSETLLVISETDYVSAEIFANKINFLGHVLFFEKNKFANTQIMNVTLNVLSEYANSISPDVIGAAVYNVSNYSYKINLLRGMLSEDATNIVFQILGQKIVISPKMIHLFVVCSLIFGVVLFSSAYFILDSVTKNYQKKLEEINSKISNLNSQITSIQGSSEKVDIDAVQLNILKQNKIELSYYDAIAIDLAENIWLTNFYTDSNGAVLLRGESTSIDLIYTFFKNIKSFVTGSDLTLTKLEFKDSANLDKLYSSQNLVYIFELSNPKFLKVVDKLAKETETQNSQEPQNLAMPSADKVLIETIKASDIYTSEKQTADDKPPKNLPKN